MSRGMLPTTAMPATKAVCFLANPMANFLFPPGESLQPPKQNAIGIFVEKVEKIAFPIPTYASSYTNGCIHCCLANCHCCLATLTIPREKNPRFLHQERYQWHLYIAGGLWFDSSIWRWIWSDPTRKSMVGGRDWSVFLPMIYSEVFGFWKNAKNVSVFFWCLVNCRFWLGKNHVNQGLFWFYLDSLVFHELLRKK